MEEKYQLSKKIIALASYSFKGYVWGSFVWNVILSKSIDPDCEVDFDSIKLSFENEKLKKSFNIYLSLLIEKLGYRLDSGNDLLHHVIKNDKTIITINTLINYPDEPIGCDIDRIKFVSYNDSFKIVDDLKINTSLLMDNILNRRVTISDNFFKCGIFFNPSSVIKLEP